MFMSPSESAMFADARFDFSGRRALIVGGSKGIGRGLVEAFHAMGANVVYAARTPMNNGDGAEFVRTDIRHEAEILDLFRRVDQGGNLDILINVAAINQCKKIEAIDISEWDDVLDVNLRAAFLLCREAAIRMKKIGGGKIVNVSSIAGRHRSPVAGVHYTSSKAGIIGLTRQLAFELGPFGINVNVVCPSQTMTDMLREAMTPDQMDALAQSIPIRRIAAVKEQVGPILYLCSEAASYITGAQIDVNGGQI
jgi:3-oxoacyl-[acyl-carrier protein] reductase